MQASATPNLVLTTPLVPRRASQSPPDPEKFKKSFDQISRSISVIHTKQRSLETDLYRTPLSERNFSNELLQIASEIEVLWTKLQKRGDSLPFLQDKPQISRYFIQVQKLSCSLHQLKNQNQHLQKTAEIATRCAKKTQECLQASQLGQFVGAANEFLDDFKNPPTDPYANLLYRDTITFFLHRAKSFVLGSDALHALTTRLEGRLGDTTVPKIEPRRAGDPVGDYKSSFPSPDTASELIYKPPSWLMSWFSSSATPSSNEKFNAIVSECAHVAQGITYMTKDVAARIDALCEQRFHPARECKTLQDEAQLYKACLKSLNDELKVQRERLITFTESSLVREGLQYLSLLRMRIEELNENITLFQELSNGSLSQLRPLIDTLVDFLQIYSQSSSEPLFLYKFCTQIFILHKILIACRQPAGVFFAKHAEKIHEIVYTIVQLIESQFVSSSIDFLSIQSDIFEKKVVELVDRQSRQLHVKLKAYIVHGCLKGLFYRNDYFDPTFDRALYAVSRMSPFKDAYLHTVQHDDTFGELIQLYTGKAKLVDDDTQLKALVGLEQCLVALEQKSSDPAANIHTLVYWFAKARNHLSGLERSAHKSLRTQVLLEQAITRLTKIQAAEQIPSYAFAVWDGTITYSSNDERMQKLYGALQQRLWASTIQNLCDAREKSSTLRGDLSEGLEPLASHAHVRHLLTHHTLHKIVEKAALTTHEELDITSFFILYLKSREIQRVFWSIHGTWFVDCLHWMYQKKEDLEVTQDLKVTQFLDPQCKALLQHYSDFQGYVQTGQGRVQNSPQHLGCASSLEKVIVLSSIQEVYQSPQLSALQYWIETKMQADIKKYFK